MINPGSAFDFESEPQIDLMVTVTDQTGLSGSMAVSLGITDIDEVPTAMTLSSYGIRLDEGPTTARKLADIAFTDDALGTNQVQEIDHTLFEVRRGSDAGTELGSRTGAGFRNRPARGDADTDVTGIGPSPPQSFTPTVLDGTFSETRPLQTASASPRAHWRRNLPTSPSAATRSARTRFRGSIIRCSNREDDNELQLSWPKGGSSWI